MKLKSRDLVFLAIVIFVVGGLWLLSTRNKAKAMPSNAEHAAARSRDDCLRCHTPQQLGDLELRHKHPGKWKDARVACTLCHPAAK